MSAVLEKRWSNVSAKIFSGIRFFVVYAFVLVHVYNMKIQYMVFVGACMALKIDLPNDMM